MSGDYSRRRFDPQKHYQGVLRQQGRVDLDADWNEYIDLQDRRWRAETIDVVGRCGVPAETPDGFRIEIAGNQLRIGPGRIYVDGFLAENHGSSPAFNPSLEEPYGTAAISASQQPYGAAPIAFQQGVRTLVYVAVWRREVTPLQDPGLIEPAVNVDTTTRYQTVWQVRALSPLASDATCQTPFSDISNWPGANRPSGARLTTGTVVFAAQADPCLVPPTGGYRGMENHLYRVEVHTVTGGGTTWVKWSRENANVAAQVLEILPGGTGIRLDTVGRDDVLRFKTGDWVEITSDSREFSGTPGEIRKVVVDDGSQTLTFSVALPNAEFPEGAPDAALHLRAIRWDQSGIVRKPDGSELVNLDMSATGLIPLTAANSAFVLEDGIQVSLDVLPGAPAHSGDYWCFAARTADANIETLDHAAPAGIHHHFCNLAIIEPNGQVVDCRDVFPPLTDIAPGCCTAIVRPGESIQAALDSLPAEGGCVCLKPGLHEISDPVRIEKSNVTLHGETSGARVSGNKGAMLLQVSHPDGMLLENVTVAHLHFEPGASSEQQNLQAVILVDRSSNATITECTIRGKRAGNLAAVAVSRSANFELAGCRVSGVDYGLWALADSTLLCVAGNTFEANDKDDKNDKNEAGGIAGVFLVDTFGPSRIEKNNITGFHFGIVLNNGVLSGVPFSNGHRTVIEGNNVIRLNSALQSESRKAFGIDVAANDCVVRDNLLVYAADAYGGIIVSGAHATVEGNTVHSTAPDISDTPSMGILVARVTAQGILGTVGGRVCGNIVTGAQDGILAAGNTGLEVSGNRVESTGAPVRFGILLVGVSRGCVSGNEINNSMFVIAAGQGVANKFVENDLSRGGRAFTFLTQTSMEVGRNRVEDMSEWGLIGLQWFGKATLIENRFFSCGYGGTPSISIGVSQHLGELHIESCEVMNTGVHPDGASVSQLAWGIFADQILEARVQSNLISYANAAVLDANQEHRALWMRGMLEQTITMASTQIVFGFSAHVLDNKFLGPGRSALVETAQMPITDNVFRRFERLFFNNNFCWHMSVASQAAATVSLAARSAIVMGNHIKNVVPVASVDFHGMKDAVYMGNIAQTNPANFGGVPTPVGGFNKP